MNGVEYLDLEDVMELVRVLVIGPVRDIGLLDLAINRPRSSEFAEDAYGTVDLMAAPLPPSLTKNHALVSGNKRIASLGTVVFCDLNGVVLGSMTTKPSISCGKSRVLMWTWPLSQHDYVSSGESS